MNALDYALLLVVGTTLVWGAVRGPWSEGLRWVAWLGAIAALLAFGGSLEAFLLPHLTSATLAAWVAVLFTLLGGWFAGVLLIRLMETFQQEEKAIRWQQRLAGAALGVGRGLTLMLAAMLVLLGSVEDLPDAARQSRLMPWVVEGAQAVGRLHRGESTFLGTALQRRWSFVQPSIRTYPS
ncbi:MAG: CvpA family protein [Magnetococcales bacterium]|nr:CvpA family protein [Magnetococcales bacterium]